MKNDDQGQDRMAAGAATRDDPAAIFYDGSSNRKRAVTLAFDAAALDVIEAGARIARWPYSDIRRADNPRGLRLRAISAPALARLDIVDVDLAARVAEHCPALEAMHAPRQTWRIVGWSLAAALSIALVTIFGLPLIADRLAPMIPVALEKRIGEAVDSQIAAMFGRKACAAPRGAAALNALIGRLREAGDIKVPIDAQVLDSPVPNAFALPGGKIYVLDGLLQKAQSADELAGVIAHELGHVRNRDNLRKVIQTGGSSFLIGLFVGDVTGGSAVIFAGRSILDASYSREAETRADDFAASLMRRLGRSPKPLGEFLVRLTGDKTRTGLLDSHPVSAARLARLGRDGGPAEGAALLGAAQWQALKGICKAAP